MQLQYFFLKTICFLYQDIYSSCSTSYICNYICLPATPFNGKKYTCSNTKKYPKNVTRLLTINTVISLMHVPLVYIHRTWNLFFRLNWWKIQLNVIIWITSLSLCNYVNNTKVLWNSLYIEQFYKHLFTITMAGRRNWPYKLCMIIVYILDLQITHSFNLFNHVTMFSVPANFEG